MKILLLLLLSATLHAETTATDERVVGVFYMKPLLGHVHQSAARESASLTTIQCAHPVKVLETSKVHTDPKWAYVEVADHRGFILKEYLSEKRPDCFQGRYPKFYDSMNLDLAELYYWGRLYDHYIQGHTRVH
jgi:hypothetical protein